MLYEGSDSSFFGVISGFEVYASGLKRRVWVLILQA